MKFLALIFLLLFNVVHASLDPKDPAVAAIIGQKEDELIKLLSSQGKNKQQITDTYIELAERMQMQREEKLAHWLYSKALARKNASQPVLLLSALALAEWRLGMSKEGLKHVELGLALLPKNKNGLEMKYAARLVYLKVLMSGKLIKEALNQEEQEILNSTTTYNQDLFFHQVLVHFKQKEFSAALDMFGGKDIKDAVPNEKLIYDFAMALGASGERKRALYCESTKNERGYLRGLSLAAKACPMLEAIAAKKKINRQQLNEFKAQLVSDAPDLKLLGSLLDSYIQ